jgi:hypothetical protein
MRLLNNFPAHTRLGVHSLTDCTDCTVLKSTGTAVVLQFTLLYRTERSYLESVNGFHVTELLGMYCTVLHRIVLC